jgi:capsular polysaccharide biosynthesis protein
MYVVGGHGAALANIMYCAPGTRVLELSPDGEYRSLYAELSDKLGLVHAILPCATQDDDFFGAMQVDVTLLGKLLLQLQNWS